MAKKRHHYIPRFYLKGFIDPNNTPYIWIYDKDGKEPINKGAATDIAVKKHYFSFHNIDDQKDSDTIENIIKDIENNAAPVFQKIIQEEPLKEKDRIYFSTFLAFMLTRVPNYRKNVENSMGELIKKTMLRSPLKENIFEPLQKGIEEAKDKTAKAALQKAHNYMLDGEFNVKVDPERSLDIAINSAKRIIPILNEMKWKFVRATKDYNFLTGDNPIYYNDPTHDLKSFYEVGLLNKNVELTFPITQDLALFASWKEMSRYVEAKPQTIKFINKRTTVAALRFIFASENLISINDFVQKYKGSAPKIKVG